MNRLCLAGYTGFPIASGSCRSYSGLVDQGLAAMSASIGLNKRFGYAWLLLPVSRLALCFGLPALCFLIPHEFRHSELAFIFLVALLIGSCLWGYQWMPRNR